MKKFNYIIILIVILSLGISYASEEKEKKKILVLNSYSPYYSWSRDQLNGVLEGLDKKFSNDKIYIENMDTKRYSEFEYYNKLKKIYEYKYKDMEFDSVITIDNNAFDFALKYRKILFNEAPIFFSGINNLESYDIEALDNIYGVSEETSVIETLKFAKIFNPEIDEIIYFIENTTTGKLETSRIVGKINSEDEFKNIKFNDISYMPFNEILGYIKDNKNKNAIILVPFFIKDINGKNYTNKEVVQKVRSKSNIPVYGLYSFQFHHGIVGGKIVDAYSQGERIPYLMERYFNNDFENRKYYENVEVNQYKFDYREIKAFGYENVKLPDESVVYYKPVGFLEKNKVYILGFFLALFAPIVYIKILKKQINLKTNQLNDYYKKMIEKEKEMIEYKKIAGLSEVIVQIAHEINTPLGSALTGIDFIDSLNSQIEGSLKSNNMSREELEEYIEQNKNTKKIIRNNLKVIASLVDEFKMINKGIFNKKKEINLRELLDELVLEVEETLAYKNIFLYYNCEKTVKFIGDKEKIKRIFNLLIDNSVKHGFSDSEDGIIKIDVIKHKNNVEFIYSDDGKGIEEEKLNKIFDPFYSTNKTKNKGLGLYYVYNSIRAMKGKIKVKSKKNKGVVYKIYLPLVKK